MMTMIAFHNFSIFLLTTLTYSYHLQCPVESQRPLRAQTYCTSRLRSEYTCLYDTNRIMFSERCYKNPDYVTRGEKYVITGRLRNVDCSSERYQPFPLWANVSGVCLFRKTLCEEEGQVVFDSGNLISDGACRCDFSKGYKFIQQPKKKCFCIPSDEDCSCHISQCTDGLHLSSDYECIGEEHHNDSKCPALEMKGGSWHSKIITRHYDEGFKKSFNTSDYYKVIVIGFVVCLLLLLAIVIKGKVWKPDTHKMIIVLILFVALLSCIDSAVMFVEHNLNTVAVGVSLLTACAVLGTVYVVYIFSTHQLVKPQSVYDELYELHIYKLLKAASKGDMKHLKRIDSENYIDINDTDYNLRSALHLAACEGHHEAVEYLLKNNAGYLGRKDRCLGHTPAEDAVWHKKRNYGNASKSSLQKIIHLLKIQKGLQKYKCSFKDSVVQKMMKAADNGEVSVLKSMHDLGTDMNLSDHDGRTALHAAVENNQENVVNFLIEVCKVSPFQRWRGQRPEDLIRPQICKPEIVRQLRVYMKTDKMLEHQRWQKEEKEKGENEDLKIVRILNSAFRGDIRQIRAYKEAGYNMNVSDYDKRTALHIAVNNNQEHIVEFLLDKCRLNKEAVKAQDRWGLTPLDTALQAGKENLLVHFRRHYKPLSNTEDFVKYAFTLCFAGEEDDVETFKRLCESGEQINIQNFSGSTVWNLAVDEWNTDAIQYLKDKSKDNGKSHKGVIVTCQKGIDIRQTFH